MGIKVNITRPIYIRKGPGRGFKEIGVINPSGLSMLMDGIEQGESWKGLANWYYKIDQSGQRQYYWEGGVSLDTSLDLHWSLRLLGVDKLWQHSKGEGINVAILDTGIDTQNADLQVYKAYNILDDSAEVKDRYYHGTYCASILKAKGGRGVYGVAPNANLIVIKIQERNDGNAANRAKGIEKAIALGAHIISMSFGSKDNDDLVANAIAQAMDKGIVCVAAAGNVKSTPVEYPANIKGMIAVGNLACDNPLIEPAIFRISMESKKASGNVDEEGITIAAPGEGLIAYNERGALISNITGTSFATPFVAGIAAIWLSIAKSRGVQMGNPHQTFREQLIKTANAQMPGYDQAFWGAGLIDPLEILKTIIT